MGFVERGIVIGDFKGGTGHGGKWDSSSNKTMLRVVFGSFFTAEESTHFLIMEDVRLDEVAP
jgi:hypothetical protein